MKRPSVALGILTIGLLVVASVGLFFIIQPRLNQGFDFQWAVSIDDEFIYSVTVRGVNMTYEYDSVNETQIYYESPLSIAILNESVILARVVNLPEFPEEVNRSSFGELIRTIKVDCSLANGSEILEMHRVWLNRLISTGLLPIGGWSFLDELYPSPPSYVCPSGNDQYTRRFEGHFQIVDVWGGVESGYWAQGNVSLENGFSFEGYLKRSDYIPYPITETYSWYHFQIELVLLFQ